MKSTETFLSADGKTHILSYWYVPESPRAVVRICHGMSEHIGRRGYDALALLLEENGYAVCAHDYIGHGGSAGKKEDLGHFGDRQGAEYLLRDVQKLGMLAAKRFPGIKQAIIGHSMGSLITRKYLTEHPGEAACAVIMGTLGPLPDAPVALTAAKIITAAEGPRSYSKLLYNMAFGSYLKRIPDSKSEFSWLSTDEREVEAYDADKLCGFPFTNAAMVDLISIYAAVSRRDWAGKLSKKTPLLFLSGSEDPCGGYGKGVRKIYDRVKNAGIPAELKIFEGARHELLNERCREDVFAGILGFLDKTL